MLHQNRILYTIMLLIFLNINLLHAGYIQNAIVVCQDIEDLKQIQPHIHKNSNQIFIPQNCMILTKNAKIDIIKVVQENYILINITDLNLKVYTLKSTLSRL